MSPSQKIAMRRTKVRERLAAIAKIEGDDYNEEIVAEERSLQTEYEGLEQRERSAIIAEERELDDAKGKAGGDTGDAEERARQELRGKCRITNFVRGAVFGKRISGPEAELASELEIDRGIPMELFEPTPAEERARQERAGEERAVTPAPGTVGINLDPIRPAVFAPSIAPRLMVDMPRVPSGTYATGTISTSTTADAVAKSADVPQTAGAITVGTTSPHRVGASLSLTLEDILAVGTENFESVLRQNISLALADHYDDMLINGDTTTEANELEGMFKRLTNPSAPAANVETWTRFLAIQSGGIDGLWATELEHIAMVVGVDTYRLAAATFQGTDSEESAASYLKRMGGGFWTNSRMPAKVNHVQQGILCRKGQPGVRTAVAPVWGELSIDDVYTGARKGERYYTVSVMVGDVILVQPNAYAQVAFRVSA